MRRPPRSVLDSAAILPAVVLGVLVVVAAGLLISGIVHPVNVAACITSAGPPPTQPPPPAPSWWVWVIVVGAVGGFALGHGAGYLRHRLEAAGLDSEAARHGSRVVQLMILAFLVLGVVLTAYETLSVVPDRSTADFWPISYYVRCTNDVAPYPTLLATTVVAFLLGHWFCHPATRADDGRSHGR